MIYKLTFKDPDFHTSVNNLSPAALELMDEYLYGSEYITVEFNTETRTARVVPVKEQPC